VRKSLTKRPALPNKRIAFIALAALLLAGGAIWRVAYYVNAPQAPAPEATSPEAASPQASPEAASPEAAPANSAAKTDLPPPQPAAKEAEPATAALPPPQAPSPQVPSPQVPSPQAAAPEAASPSEQAEGSPSSAPSTDATQQGTESSGPILVSKRPVQVLAGPSSTSPALYGFPSGRPFRLIGHQGNFAQIKDLRSGASGWIDETALAELPPAAASRSSGSSPSLSSSPSQSRSVASSQPQGAPKSRAASKGGQISANQPDTTDTDTGPTRRPGLLGGIFGGIFGGGN